MVLTRPLPWSVQLFVSGASTAFVPFGEVLHFEMFYIKVRPLSCLIGLSGVAIACAVPWDDAPWQKDI
jgi:hypothetical protein